MATRRTGILVGVVTGLVLATGPVGAQTSPPAAADPVERLLDRPPPADGPEPVREVAQDPAEQRVTRALNDEIVQRNRLAENQEQADRAAFEAARAEHERAVARALQARLDHEAALREAAAAQARWEADVRACNAGDRSRCGVPGGL